MIDVIIDSDIFHQDLSRRREVYQTLSRLADANLLRIHVPYVVLEEHQAHLREAVSKPVKAAQPQLARISRYVNNKDLTNRIRALSSQLKDAAQEASDFMVADFQAWLHKVKAISHRVAPDHGDRVLKAYFDGSNPFREARARDDFPDAFIFETIRDLSNDCNPLMVITQDRRMAEACRALPRVTVFTSLDSFIQDESCQAAIREHDVQVNLATFAQLINEEKDRIIISIGNDVVDQLAMQEVSSSSIPDDSNQALIMSVDEPFDLSLEGERISYYGGGTIVIPISFRVEVNVEYYIYKTDYYCLRDSRAKKIHVSEYDNEHYFDASETLTLSVRGLLAAKIDPAALQPSQEDELDPANAMEGIEYSLDSIDTIEVEDPDEDDSGDSEAEDPDEDVPDAAAPDEDPPDEDPPDVDPPDADAPDADIPDGDDSKEEE